ncbi:MAG: hypothetical protein C0407_05620 [Desulfobacca sp.]|nr:hypothetical protein [Desulfobacca sp.]
MGGTMDIRTYKLLAEYNQNTNDEMNDIIKTLSDSQWNAEFGGYFSSIKSLCNHLYIGDFNWLKRFSKLRKFEYIENSLFSKEIQFGTIVLTQIGDYLSARRELDKCITAFVKEINNNDIDSLLEYTDSHGKTYRRNLGGLVHHMFNHQTHHRGMISIYLDEMKIKNDFSNMANML